MHYNGGKAAVAKEFASIIASREGGGVYWEPFVGAASVICRPELSKFQRKGSDASKWIIALLIAVKQGWVPPTHVSEEEYLAAKANDPALSVQLRAFIGYGCSFGGKWFGGYARSGTRNYALNAHNSLLKQAPVLDYITLYWADYRQQPYGFCDVIYCDPPYKGTTRCGSSDEFDHEEFWTWCRARTYEGSKVYVSELAAPPDFTELYHKPIRDGLRRNDKQPMVERLFICNR
jgi:DNA adenine methylase